MFFTGMQSTAEFSLFSEEVDIVIWVVGVSDFNVFKFL